MDGTQAREALGRDKMLLVEARRELDGLINLATLGVLSTIIATPPNAVFASLAPDVLGFEVGFGQWMLVGVPMACVGGL